MNYYMKDRFTGSRIDTEELRERISDGEGQYFSSTTEPDPKVELEMRAGFAESEKLYLDRILKVDPEALNYDSSVIYNDVMKWDLFFREDLPPEEFPNDEETVDKTRTYRQRKGASWREQRKKRSYRAQKAAKKQEHQTLNDQGPEESWKQKALRREVVAIEKGFTNFTPLFGAKNERQIIMNGHSTEPITPPDQLTRIQRIQPPFAYRPSHSTAATRQLLIKP